MRCCERAAEGTLTDLCPVMLDTLTMHPLVLMRWGTHSWVMWYTDLRQESTRHVLQRPTGNTLNAEAHLRSPRVPPDVDGHHAVVLSQVGRLDAPHRQDPGAVHQDVQAAVVSDGLLHGPPHRLLVC